jgi:hypothetical protein
MKHHLLCLTIDTDPDGLSGKITNRRSLTWEGLTQVEQLPYDLADSFHSVGTQVPITWFVRLDRQLREVFGTSLYLIENFGEFWERVGSWGHEIGWHPHLYRQSGPESEPTLMTDPVEACEELNLLWNDLATCSFKPKAFRNGEGWQHPKLLSTIEKIGLLCDSTAIPGRKGELDHPMNWMGAPNQPYFPDGFDIRKPGAQRPLLEIPMNTWHVKAPYENHPRLRYMNPAIHEPLFMQALDRWGGIVRKMGVGLYVWVLVFHPDEVMATSRSDGLYAHSRQTVCQNLGCLIQRIQEMENTFELTILSEAAVRWRQYRGVNT